MTAKCCRSIIASDCGNHSCGQCQAGGRLDHWSDDEGSWWVIECEKIKIVAALRLLIAKYAAEKKNMFHTHCSVMNSGIEFIHEVYLNHVFNEFENYQQLNLIEEILNKDCFKGFIIKIVMLNGNVQEFSIIFLKMVIFLLAGLQFESDFHDWIQRVI